MMLNQNRSQKLPQNHYHWQGWPGWKKCFKSVLGHGSYAKIGWKWKKVWLFLISKKTLTTDQLLQDCESINMTVSIEILGATPVGIQFWRGFQCVGQKKGQHAESPKINRGTSQQQPKHNVHLCLSIMTIPCQSWHQIACLAIFSVTDLCYLLFSFCNSVCVTPFWMKFLIYYNKMKCFLTRLMIYIWPSLHVIQNHIQNSPICNWKKILGNYK